MASDRVVALLDALAGNSYIEGRTLTVRARWADGYNDRLSGLAKELIESKVDLLIALDSPSARAAQTVTSELPIIFYSGGDPVATGLVASLGHPGGNLTGVSGLTQEIAPKRLELLHELLPNARTIALLVNPDNEPSVRLQVSQLSQVTNSLSMKLEVLKARRDEDLSAVFSDLSALGRPPLIVGADPYLTRRSPYIARLAFENGIASVNQYRDFVEAGGLISYGGNIRDSFRLMGLLASRVLKGEKPAVLPVEQSKQVDLILNLRTARSFGLDVPLSILGRASEVIE